MSLPSTSTLRGQLNTVLGPRADGYWSNLRAFLAARISRDEFETAARDTLDTPHLVHLHNALLISLFDTSSAIFASSKGSGEPNGVREGEEGQARRKVKKRRLEPFEEARRVKRWAVSVGRRERERLRALENAPPPVLERPLPPRDEIQAPRGVVLLPERGEPAGSRLSVSLAAHTRAPTLQHIADRINLISAQHNLAAPPKAVSSLLMLAFEAKLKQLLSRALTLTSASRAITSIQPARSRAGGSALDARSFDTLFTLSPAVLPNGSAAALRLLALGDPDAGADAKDETAEAIKKLGLSVAIAPSASNSSDVSMEGPGESGGTEGLGQMLALLAAQRSAVREALRSVR